MEKSPTIRPSQRRPRGGAADRNVRQTELGVRIVEADHWQRARSVLFPIDKDSYRLLPIV